MTTRLLVLDDDETAGLIAVACAESLGLEAHWCSDARAFLQTVATWAPTHVLLDLSMPDMDGHEVLRRLAALDRSVGAVIIASGGSLGEREAALRHAQALQLPVVGTLSKPISKAALAALLSAAARPGTPPHTAP